MMELGWEQIGAAIGAVGAVGAGIWGTIISIKKKLAEARADVATARSEQAVADAQGTVYSLLKDRLLALETRIAQLEASNQQKDEVIRQLHDHISRLEMAMRDKGIDPPTLIIAQVRAPVV